MLLCLSISIYLNKDDRNQRKNTQIDRERCSLCCLTLELDLAFAGQEKIETSREIRRELLLRNGRSELADEFGREDVRCGCLFVEEGNQCMTNLQKRVFEIWRNFVGAGCSSHMRLIRTLGVYRWSSFLSIHP